MLSTKTTTIQDQGPLRVSLAVEIKISDRSSIKQVISLDTGSPYLRFQTQVSLAERASKLYKESENRRTITGVIFVIQT